MQVVIEIPDVPIQDYKDLIYKIHGMAASEGLFDDKEKSQRALALKAVLDILGGIVNGTPLPKGHGDLIDRNDLLKHYDSTTYHNGIEERKIHFVQIGYVNDAPAIIEADKE